MYIWFVPSFISTLKTKCKKTDGKSQLVDLITAFNETIIQELLEKEKKKVKKNNEVLRKLTENEKIALFEVYNSTQVIHVLLEW